MKIFRLHMSMHLISPQCDACAATATHALKFNSDGDKVFMCDAHYSELLEEVRKNLPKGIESTEQAQADG